MTNAPTDLLAIRQYLLKVVDLAGDAVGIVGDPAHASSGGYHEGNDDLARVGRLNSDYSKRESGRDQPGTNSASALDIGDFSHNGLTLRAITLALVAACQRGDPRTRDIREVIYTPDGSTVRRWDRLGIRDTGDSSHLYHTHLSFFRDSEGRRAAPDNILGLLVELIEGTHTQEDDMGQQLLIADSNGQVWLVDGLTRMRVSDVAGAGNNQSHASGLLGNLGNGGAVARFGTPPAAMDAWGVDVGGRLAALDAAVAELRARPAGTVALTEQDKADLVAGFRAAAVSAVREVLGSLDGAIPPVAG